MHKTSGRKAQRGGLLLLLLLLCALPGHARPQALIVLADHLTLADVTRPDLPGFAALTRQGRLALMSPGLAHGPDPLANAYATLGAGDSVAVGDVSQGRLGVALRAAGLRVAVIGQADGDDTGPYRPVVEMLPQPDSVYDPTLPAATSPGGRRTDPALLWTETRLAEHSADLIVVHFGDFVRLERENAQGDLTPAAYVAHREAALRALDRYLQAALAHPDPDRALLFAVPAPPPAPDGKWDRLTPFVLIPPSPTPPELAVIGGGAGGLLTSDTTQTAGLIAARDLAPTLLALFAVPALLQMTGAVVRPAGPGDLRRLDRQAHLDQQAQDPLFWGLGLSAPVIIFSGLALFLTGRLARGGRACGPVLYGLRLLAAWPLALLLAPLLPSPTVGVALAVIAALTGLLAVLPSPALIFSLTALALIADGLSGTALVSQSVLSGYALAGIRFYGIGNEYMGLLLGGALLAAATTRLGPPRRHLLPSPKRGTSGLGRGQGEGFSGLGTFLWFALVTLVLSFPAFGAKAGGAVTATATFALAWLRLRGVRLRPWHLLLGLAAGFALVFLWALLGDALHLRRTHLATAVGALEGGRFGYIWGVAVRKLGLAARVFGHPGTLLGLLALALLGVAARVLLWKQVGAYLLSHPRLSAVAEAGLWGAGVCVLFNDSGIVAAILLLSCLILPVLHGLFARPCAFSPSTSATSASASPSVTH